MASWFFGNRGQAVVAASAVQRSQETLREQRGWQQGERGCWRGPYATEYGTWNGTIFISGGHLNPYIHNPPDEMRRHPKWVCFHKQNDGWYRVHLARQPADGSVDSVIMYVERLLAEAMAMRGK